MSGQRAAWVVALLVVLVGCGRYGPPQPLTPAPAPAAETSAAAAETEDETPSENPGSETP